MGYQAREFGDHVEPDLKCSKWIVGEYKSALL